MQAEKGRGSGSDPLPRAGRGTFDRGYFRMRPPPDEERDEPPEDRDTEPELRDEPPDDREIEPELREEPLEDREDALERDGELRLREGALDPVEPELCRDRRADPEGPCGDRDGALRLGADPPDDLAATLERDGEVVVRGVRTEGEAEEPDPEGALRIRFEEEEVLAVLREADPVDREGKLAVPDAERRTRDGVDAPVSGVRIVRVGALVERPSDGRSVGLERITRDSSDREGFSRIVRDSTGREGLSRIVRPSVAELPGRATSGVRAVAPPERFTVSDVPRSGL